MEKLQYIFLTLLASASFQDVFVYCDATDYLHACPNPDKPLGWTDAGKFVKEIWPKYFGSLDNQPWTLIANEQATVNCCDENGGCIRMGKKIGFFNDCCIFPFTYNGVSYNECINPVLTTADPTGRLDPLGQDSGLWCATEINDDGSMKEWKNCDESCSAFHGKCFPYNATFIEAAAICKSEGRRLCRSDEMLAFNCCGQGCRFDNSYGWIDNTCPEPFAWNGQDCGTECLPQWMGENCNECAPAWVGENCDQCATGHYGENCRACMCNDIGSTGTCDDIGRCTCIDNWSGPKCYQCVLGWTGENCDQCAIGWSGENCDQCTSGYDGYPYCKMSDTSAETFVAKLESYGMTLLMTHIPTDLSEEFNSLDLSAKKSVLLDLTMPVEVAELLLENDQGNVGRILEDNSVVDRLGKTCDEDEGCLALKIHTLEEVISAEEASESFYAQEIARKNASVTHWTTRLNNVELVVDEIVEAWGDVVVNQQTDPGKTKARMTEMLKSKCCTWHIDDTADKDFMAYRAKNEINTSGTLDWQTYKVMQAKVDNALSFDPLSTKTQSEIVASTKLALQKKQRAAVRETGTLANAKAQTANYIKSTWPGIKAMSRDEKIEKVGTALGLAMGGVAKFGTVNEDMSDSQKALRIASGVADIASAVAEFLPPPASIVTGTISNMIGIFDSTPSTEDVVREQFAIMKDFMGEKFEEQRKFVDGKFEEQQEFISDSFLKQQDFIDGKIDEINSKLDENNVAQYQLFQLQLKNLQDQKNTIVQAIENLNDTIDDAIDELKDFFQNEKMVEISIDAESLLAEIEEKLYFLQADDNTNVDDHIADAIDRRINTMGRTYEVNRIKNNFETYCVDNQIRSQCKQTPLQKSLCFGIAYAYFSIEKNRHTTLLGLINLLQGTSYRNINVRYLEVIELRTSELIDWTSDIFQDKDIVCPMFYMETHLWLDDNHMDMTYNYLSEMNPYLKEYLDDLSFDKCKAWQEKFRKDCCQCNEAGSVNLLCTSIIGDFEGAQCKCRNDVPIGGLKCDQCNSGYFQFPNCYNCGCNNDGTIDNGKCDDTGVCTCLTDAHWTGDKCDKCMDRYYLDDDFCGPCMCDDDNSELNGACTAAQFCRCKGGFGGPKCAKVSTVAKETALALATRDICQDDANYDDLNDAYVSGANINGDKAPDPGIWYAINCYDGNIGSGKIDLVQWFLDRNLDVNHDYSWHFSGKYHTLLSLSAMSIDTSVGVQVMQLLLDYGADIDFQSHSGHWRYGIGTTPLMKAAFSRETKTSGELMAFQVLIENGANVNITDDNGYTALSYLAVYTPDNVEKMVQLLLDAGADIDHKDNEGYTPLMINAKERYYLKNEIEHKDEFVAALLKNGADIDYQNNKGEYALLIAAKQKFSWTVANDIHDVQLLVDAGANPHLEDNNGITACYYNRMHKYKISSECTGCSSDDDCDQCCGGCTGNCNKVVD